MDRLEAYWVLQAVPKSKPPTRLVEYSVILILAYGTLDMESIASNLTTGDHPTPSKANG